MKNEKTTWPRTDLAEHFEGLERNNFCNFDKPLKARRGASRNEFVENSGMPNRVERLSRNQ